MKTIEIPRDEWRGFFDNLSRHQVGERVALEVFGPEIGAQVEERHLILAGLTAEVSADARESDTIQIMMGGKLNSHVTHRIMNPVVVELQRTDFGIDAALNVKSGDGSNSLLYLI